jgi:preprotein translocase subunit YajC
MQFSTLLLQAAPGPGGIGGPVFLMVGMFVVMYFFMIRPQNKRAKEQKKFEDSLTTGEQIIVTTAGIHGRISRTNDDGTLQIEVSRGVFMTIERSAISMQMTDAARKRTGGATAVAAK